MRWLHLISELAQIPFPAVPFIKIALIMATWSRLCSIVAVAWVAASKLGDAACAADTAPRIAIVGAGVGGAAASYFLKEKSYQLDV